MYKLRSEEEIIATWKGAEEPVVSICCQTYNHGEYIEDAIKGFLIQETDFPFEIIIHDDASTDKTQEIIRYYSGIYPKLFKLIIQECNQYSQGSNPIFDYLLPAARGEYIAICEGDDYWCSAEKIKRQYYAIKETQFDLAFNLSAILLNGSKKFKVNVNPAIKISKAELVNYELIDIAKGGASLMRTASLFIKKSRIDALPNEYKSMPAVDIFIQIFCGLNGAICVNKIMSVYRSNVPNSWSSQNLYKIEKIQDMTLRMLHGSNHLYNTVSDSKYKKKCINQIKRRFIYQYYRIAFHEIMRNSEYIRIDSCLKPDDYLKAMIWGVLHHVDRTIWRIKCKLIHTPASDLNNSK